MTLHTRQSDSGTLVTRAVCAVCFLVFTFLWLYFFQCDLLAVGQHVLSGGVTHYDRLIGATIITVTLFLLQTGVKGVTRLSRRTYALTYVPSFLVLTFLSDISVGELAVEDDSLGSSSRCVDNVVAVGHLWWLLAVVLVLWLAAVWMARQMLSFSDGDKQPAGILSATTGINVAQVCLMMFFVASVGNSDAVTHFRAHAETALMRGDNREAMRVGWESLETDRQLTMLRAFALSREGLLGDRLFCYPIAGSGEDLLPMHRKPLLLPADSIWRHLGAKPLFPMPAATYYHLLEYDSLATSAVADYVLCGKLIDRDLKSFAKALDRYYGADAKVENTATQLPRHYREALVLCRHLYPKVRYAFSDPHIEHEWQQMEQLRTHYADDSEQCLQMLENFRETYWYYYYAK